MAMTVCGGTLILHDNAQNLKEVLVFADQCFRCKVIYIKLSWVLRFGSNLICDTVIYIIKSKLIKLKEK